MAPTKQAIGSFWQMMFENDIKLIVMLCCFKVNSKVQCEYYFGKPPKTSDRSNNLQEGPWEPVTYVSMDGKMDFKVQMVRRKLVLGGQILKSTIKVTRQKAMDIQSECQLTEKSETQEEVRFFKHL